MKVEVVCFGVLRDFLPEGTSGRRAALDVDDGAVVGDLVDRLGAPRRLVYALLVNGERADLDRSLASGDEITIMPPFSGGRGVASAGSQTGRDSRCAWAGTDERMVHYHDTEWGVPVHDDRLLYEFLVLEGAQAGLSWSTVLNKRDGYRNAFADFDPTKVARYSEKRIARLLNDTAIIRNRQKVTAAILNARAFLKVQDEFGDFDSYQWGFVDGAPVQNRWRRLDEIPALTPLSESFSKDLKKRGFRFVGPTIVYAHMQATGMVNDHLVSCYRHSELGGRGGRNARRGSRG